MYTLIFLIYFLFFNNFLFFYYGLFVLVLLIYFNYSKNLFSIHELNMFIEDRLIILLEGIVKFDYNLLILCAMALFWLSKWIKFGFWFFPVSAFMLTFSNVFLIQDFFFVELYSFTLNDKLFNGLFIIHPYCIYIFYSIIFLYLLNLHYYLKLNFYSFRFNLLNYYKIVTLVIIIGCIAIILGSWWAFQEVNWNGWWSWDLVEIINFSLIFLFVKSFHSSQFKLSSNFYLIKSIYTIFIYLSIYMALVRYNILQSLHSFLNLELSNQFKYIIVLYFFFSFFFYFILIFKKLTKGDLRSLVFNESILSILTLFIFIYFFKIFLELNLNLFNYQLSSDYLYLFRYFNSSVICIFIYFYFYYIQLINNLLFFVYIFNLSFIELLFGSCIVFLTYQKQGRFLYYHTYLVIFILYSIFGFSSLNYSIKVHTLVLYDFIINSKIDYYIIKNCIWYFFNLIPNYFVLEVTSYYFDNYFQIFFLNTKKLIFFLSDYFFYFGFLLVLKFQFSSLIAILFFEYFNLFAIVLVIPVALVLLIKKINFFNKFKKLIIV